MENYCNLTEDASEAILAFDTLFTTNHMKILKLLFPYLNQEGQKKLAVYIKWQEFVFTLHFFDHPCSFAPPSFSKREVSFTTLYPILSAYCTKEEQDFLSKISGFMNIKTMMEQFQEYLPLIQGLLSLNETNQNGLPLDLFKTLLSEEQLAMFSMFMENESCT